MLRVSDSARPVSVSLYNDIHRVAFPIVQQGRHPGEVPGGLGSGQVNILIFIEYYPKKRCF